MRVSEWVAIAERDAKSYRHVICEACGAETLSNGPVAFCSNCESAVGMESKTFEGKSSMSASLLGSLKMAVLRNDFDAAADLYGQLLRHRHSPQLLYAKGIMRIQHSNYLVSLIGYGNGKTGRNPELRETAGRLLSEGKTLIAKSRSISEIDATEAPSAYSFYRIFLCDLKMGDLRAAKANLKRIAELDREGMVASYAKIVLDSCGERYKEAESELDRIAKMGTPPANAFYYAAFIAFKKGDLKGAERLLKASGGLVEERKRANLLEAIWMIV